MTSAGREDDDVEGKKSFAERVFRESIGHIRKIDLPAAAGAALEKIAILEKRVPEPLRGLWEQVKLLGSLLLDFTRGAYTRAPYGTIAAAAGALLYFASPMDVIPDFIPGIGYVDDAAVIALCLKMIRSDLEKYRAWKDGKESETSRG